MAKRILIIGGTRFFGKRLVESLLAAGHRVTIATRGRASDPFGARVARVQVDRRDAAAMAAAFATQGGYDVVYDQMCYSPLDAAISAQVFRGRVGRYVMASTIEVYRPHLGLIHRPLREDDIALDTEPVELDYPWYAPDLPDVRYGAGKRQAEAFFRQDGSLPVVSVRIGHVLAGPEDFTGRLADYVARARQGQVLRHAVSLGASSFISAAGIAAFLCWVGEGDFLGPLNAADEGPLTAHDLHRYAAQAAGVPPRTEPVLGAVEPATLSPFDYPAPYVMDTARARALGYRFDLSTRWLAEVIGQHRPAHP